MGKTHEQIFLRRGWKYIYIIHIYNTYIYTHMDGYILYIFTYTQIAKKDVKRYLTSLGTQEI